MGPVDRLRKLPTSNPDFRTALDEVSSLLDLAARLGIRAPIELSPLLCVNPSYVGLGQQSRSQGSLFFQLSEKTKRRGILATGGRFDHLVARLASPDRRSALPRAVGATLSVGALSSALAAEQARFVKNVSRKDETESYGPYARRRCEVYVTSFAPGLLEARLELCALLWRHGIRADLVRAPSPDWLTHEAL